MSKTDLRRVAFGCFELDLESAELWSGTERVDLAPQPSKLLAILVAEAGSLVERGTLRREIWGESFTDWESGLHQAIRRIRVVLGDSASSPTFIETVPRRGYRFIAEIAPVPDPEPAPMDRAPVGPAPIAEPNPRGIAVISKWIVRATALLAFSIALVLLITPSLSQRQAIGATTPPPAALPSAAGAEARRLVEEADYLLSASRSSTTPPSAETIEKAKAKLERAAKLDPEWAAPWTTLAEIELARPGGAGVTAARQALETALVRDPEHARTWLLLGRLRLWQEWDWTGARSALERAVRLAPEAPETWQMLAALEIVEGRGSRAIEASRRAMALDPVSTALRADLGWSLYYAGHTDEALAECRRALELEPANPSAVQCALQALRLLGREDEAATTLTEGTIGATMPEEYWQARLDALDAGAPCGSTAARSLPLLASSEIEAALEALARGAAEGRGWEVPFARVDPLFEPWRSDPRFVEAATALGLPPTLDALPSDSDDRPPT